MVRRGSSVRVRQRASSQNACKTTARRMRVEGTPREHLRDPLFDWEGQDFLGSSCPGRREGGVGRGGRIKDALARQATLLPTHRGDFEKLRSFCVTEELAACL